MIRDSLLHLKVCLDQHSPAQNLADADCLLDVGLKNLKRAISQNNNKNFRILSVSVFGKWRFRIIFLPVCLLAYITI